MRAHRLSLETVVVFFLALLLALAAWPKPAHAAGSAHLKSSEVSEVSGAWHIFVRLELPKAPATPHVPMKFVFTKTAVFERAQTDTGLVNNVQSLSNQLPSTESLDVDFANAQGKIFNRTEFDFGLTRTRGYEAGEYKLQIRTSDGIDIGGPMRLTLKGDNPVVDRRSITFEAKKKGMEKVDNGVDGGAQNKPANDTDESNAAGPGNGEVTPSGTAPAFIPDSAYQPTEEEKVKEKPGGCGCTTPGSRADAPSLLALAAAVAALSGLAFARRRRRDARRA